RIRRSRSINRKKVLSPGLIAGVFLCNRPMNAEWIHIGKLVATFGVKGELIVTHALGKKTSFKGIEAVFVEERKTVYLPYFVESSKAKNTEETFLKLEGLDTRESAARLVSRNLWLREADFRLLAGKSAPISLLGYQLIADKDPLGEIAAVIEQPHQVLVQVIIQDKEALIPLHEETLQKIDHQQRKVYVLLPDGLLDIYLK
ncbi:MAG TPA: ribosome maturation factor RimM, partial [Sediminibacterium sp.]|nr:ribosome maturation factor RimM [Sediminibacterium sp.]